MKNRVLLLAFLLYSLHLFAVPAVSKAADGDDGQSDSIWDKPVKDRYFIYDGLYYHCLTDSTAEVTLQRWAGLHLYGDVVIPNRVYCEGHELLVTAIGELAFAHMNITSVTIPDYAETIGYMAFWEVKSLKNVTFSTHNNLREIQGSSFLMTGLEGVVEIPEGVRIIGGRAFYGVDGVHTWILPSTIKTVSSACLYNYSRHVDVVCHFTICPVLEESSEGQNRMFGSPKRTTIWAPDECVELFQKHYPFVFRPDIYGIPGEPNYRENVYDYLDIRPLSEYTPYDPSSISPAIQSNHEGEVVGRYNLQGVKLQQSQRGLNIVTMSDGTKHKVVVK